jgi:autotransporter-associated beta strand protein
VLIAGTAQGGNGGDGGAGGAADNSAGNGGGGGDGGVGAALIGSAASLTVAASGGALVGGEGGTGGNGGNAPNQVGDGGSGGVGGTGLWITAPGVAVANGGSVEGGNGGIGGAGGTGGHVGSHGAPGAGGIGLFAADGGTTITNAGVIQGGLAGDGTRADAILFNGSGNLLVLNGGSIAGAVEVAAGADADIRVAATGQDLPDGLITNGATVIDTGSNAMTFSGGVSGDGTLTKQGGAPLVLSGANTYTGATTVDAGTLALSGNGSIAASSDVTVAGGATFDLSGTTAGATITSLDGGGAVHLGSETLTLGNASGSFAGIIGGAGGLTLAGGTETLTGANTYSGGTTISAGTIDVGSDWALGTGAVDLAPGTRLTFAANGLSLANVFTLRGDPTFEVTGSQVDTLSGVLADGSVPGVLEKTGSGTLVLTGATTYSGGTTIAAGTLQVGTGGTAGALGGGPIDDHGTLVLDRSDAVILGQTLAGTGRIVQQGTGTLTVDGDGSALTGVTNIAAGSLMVGDAAHPGAVLGGVVDVAPDATLGGNGSVGALALSGTLAPGISGSGLGTFKVSGNATFAVGSTFQLGATPAGQAGQLAAAGQVDILGGKVVVAARAGTWAPQTVYTIVTARKGVTGAFQAVSDDQAFLTPTLAYGANAVTLTLARNDVDFAQVAKTANAKGAATAIAGLGFGNALWDAVVKLNAVDAQIAFNQASGEYAASQQTARLNDSRYVREAMNQRLRAGAEDPAATRLGGTRLTAWVHAWGHWGTTGGDGNAAGLADNGDGLLIGADLPVGAQGRVGITGGASGNSLSLDQRDARGRETSTWLGAYGGYAFDAFSVRGGLAYAWDQIPATRQIAFPGYRDRLSDNATGHTLTGFIEGAWAFHFAHGSVSPFLNLAHTKLTTGASTEAGGAAALHAYAAGENASFSTLGARGQLDLADHFDLHGELGWQHAFGGTTPTQNLQFVAGGPVFIEYGVPVAKDAGLGRVGLGWRRGNVVIDAEYEGLAGNGRQDQAARVSVGVRF